MLSGIAKPILRDALRKVSPSPGLALPSAFPALRLRIRSPRAGLSARKPRASAPSGLRPSEIQTMLSYRNQLDRIGPQSQVYWCVSMQPHSGDELGEAGLIAQANCQLLMAKCSSQKTARRMQAPGGPTLPPHPANIARSGGPGSQPGRQTNFCSEPDWFWWISARSSSRLKCPRMSHRPARR